MWHVQVLHGVQLGAAHLLLRPGRRVYVVRAMTSSCEGEEALGSSDLGWGKYLVRLSFHSVSTSVHPSVVALPLVPKETTGWVEGC